MTDPLPTTATPSSTSVSPLLPGRSGAGVTDAVRAQILATEHWSLLATRSMIWNEIFSRASMFITVLSAAVVALALVAQATAFGSGFRLFAVLVLPVVLLVGMATFLRLSDANTDDFGLVLGMNRLRHAYLELAPELEPYFVTGHHDDMAGMTQSYGLGYHAGLGRVLAATPNLIAIIDAVIFGVLAALIALLLGFPDAAAVAIGVAAALGAVIGFALLVFRTSTRVWHGVQTRFPG
jgi:hypothetical protein